MIVGAFESLFPFRLASSAASAPAPTPARTAPFPTPTPTALALPTPTPTPTPALRNLKCGYPSKICTNERAWKRDGSLHRFCEEHRARANTNQKRWAQRKARTKADKQQTNSANTKTAEEFHVDESLLQASEAMDFTDFDLTLDLLLKDASFWSPTTAQPAMWESAPTPNDDDAMEAELWAALGLGNVNMAV